jgi:hypothetical protein
LLVVVVTISATVVLPFTYGRKVSSKNVFTVANGNLLQWEKNNADSAFYQCVNETSANDNHFWFWRKSVGGSAKIMDTLYGNADGDIETYSSSTGTTDDWTMLDEITPNDFTDYVYNTGAFPRTQYVDLAVDTSLWASIDSARIISRTYWTDNLGTDVAYNLQIKYDTMGTDQILDTVAVLPNTWTTDISRPIPGITKRHLPNLEIGINSLAAPGAVDSIICTWLVLQVFGTPTPYFGLQTALANGGSVENIIAASKYTMRGDVFNREADSIYFYIGAVVTGANGPVPCIYALYTWPDSALVAQTGRFVLDIDSVAAVDRWIGLAFNPRPALTPGAAYGFACNCSTATNGYVETFSSFSGGTGLRNDPFTWTTTQFSNPMIAETVVDTGRYSAYCTFVPTSTGSSDTASCFADVDVDTTLGLGDCSGVNPRTDSVQATVRSCITGSTSKKLYFAADTADVRWVFDSMTVTANRTFVNYTSRGISTSGWTNRQLALLQLGVKRADSMATGDSVLVSWVFAKQWMSCEDEFHLMHTDTSSLFIGQISGAESYDDIWIDSTLQFGRVFGNKTRIVVSLDTAQVDFPFDDGESGDIKIDSAFLWIKCDSSVSVVGPVSFRLTIPQDQSVSIMSIVKSRVNDDTVNCHSDWDSWRDESELDLSGGGCTPIQWHTLGADSLGEDYDSVPIDTVTFVGNAYAKVNVTSWLKQFNKSVGDARGRLSGVILLLSTAEDSLGSHRLKIGNVQPFAGIDSTYLEVYQNQRVVAASSKATTITKGTSDSIAVMSDTVSFVLSRGDYGVFTSSDGVTGPSTSYTGVRSGGVTYDGNGGYRSAFVVREWNNDSNAVSKRFPPATWIIDSAKIYFRPSQLDQPGEADSMIGRVIARGAGLRAAAISAWYVPQTSSDMGKLVSSGIGGIVTCFTSGQFRVNDKSQCSFPGSISWVTAGIEDTVNAEKDLIGYPRYQFMNVTELAGPLTGDHDSVDVTAWVDSLQHKSVIWGNAIQTRLYRKSTFSTAPRVYMSNVGPYVATAADRSFLAVWASTIVAPPAVVTSPRNRLKSGKGLRSDERVFVRPQAIVPMEKKELLCSNRDWQLRSVPYWFWSLRDVIMVNNQSIPMEKWLLHRREEFLSAEYQRQES